MVTQAQRERKLAELQIQYTYIATFPITVEHPVGSGEIVRYEPGDVVPAGEWGAAAANLMEMGKIERLQVNVSPSGEVVKGTGTDRERTVPALPVYGGDPIVDTEFPLHVGAGWFVLSDGTRLRGKDAAHEAEKGLVK